MVQNTPKESKTFLQSDVRFMAHMSFLGYITSIIALFLTGFKMERISRGDYIHKFMTCHFNESVERISEESDSRPPYIHLMFSAESVKSELEKCNIVPQPKTLLYTCKELQTVYIQGQVINSVEKELERSLLFPMSYEALPNKYLYFITELGIAKYIVSTKQPSLSQVDGAISTYCRLGQSSYATNSGSDLEREAILETHVRVSNFVIDDISLRQQLIAFNNGWSGKSCD